MIDGITVASLAEKINGQSLNISSELDASLVQGVSIDSRSLAKGDIFLAIKGEHFDGHQFIATAFENGASLVVLSETAYAENYPAILVDDTYHALRHAAHLNRSLFQGKLIALTGSSGKTSTKNILASILSTFGKTSATAANLNNEYGVPLTLLNISTSDEYAVVEMGARKVGDIAHLVEIATPDVAILLNAGNAHIDIFGSYDNIVAAKSEIYEGLSEQGIAVVNLDDPASSVWLEKLKGTRTITFSTENANADLYAFDVQCSPENTRFEVGYKGVMRTVNMPLPGMHSVKNALAACAAVLSLGFTLDDAIKPLSTLQASNNRLSLVKVKGLDLYDDSYNANPLSVKAAIDVLSLNAGYKVLVLGEMAELGALSHEMHLDVARYAIDHAIDECLFIGAHAEDMALEIKSERSAKQDKSEIVDRLEELAQREDEKITVLVKGSRSAKMEEVIHMFQSRAA